MTMQMSEQEIAQWRDKKRYLWLMGLIAPTALFVVMPLAVIVNVLRLSACPSLAIAGCKATDREIPICHRSYQPFPLLAFHHRNGAAIVVSH